MRKLVIGVLVAGVFGCAPKVYTHPTKNAQDFERDKYQCEKIAEQSAANTGAKGNPFIIVQEQQRCLELQMGWVPQQQQQRRSEPIPASAIEGDHCGPGIGTCPTGKACRSSSASDTGHCVSIN
jgi:hypothetical protein